MKKQIIVVLLSIVTLAIYNNASAQRLKANVSAGFNISQMDGDELYGFKHVGFSGGVGIAYPLAGDYSKGGFMLATDILFYQRGSKNSNIADPFAYEATLSYIDIPFLIQYMDKKAGVTFGVGVQYGRLIKTNENWTLTDSYIQGMDRPLDTSSHSFLKNDLSYVAQFRFNIWKGFKCDIRWQYSIIPIRKDFTFFNSYNASDPYYKTWQRDFKNHSLSIRLVYVIDEPSDEYKTKPRRRKTAY